LKELLKNITSDLRGLVVQKAALWYLGGLSAFSAAWYNAKQLVVEVLQTPTPVWGTLVLVLLVMVNIHLKTVENHSLSKPPVKKEMLFESDGFKWKAVIHSPNHHAVENVPFCKIHDKRLIELNGNFVCPDKNIDVCETVLKPDKYQLLKDIAESEAEYIIRTKHH